MTFGSIAKLLQFQMHKLPRYFSEESIRDAFSTTLSGNQLRETCANGKMEFGEQNLMKSITPETPQHRNQIPSLPVLDERSFLLEPSVVTDVEELVPNMGGEMAQSQQSIQLGDLNSWDQGSTGCDAGSVDSYVENAQIIIEPKEATDIRLQLKNTTHELARTKKKIVEIAHLREDILNEKEKDGSDKDNREKRTVKKVMSNLLRDREAGSKGKTIGDDQ